MTNDIEGSRSPSCRLFDTRGSRTMIVALILTPVLLFGQNPPAAPSKAAEGATTYAQRCAGCHGADAHGTDHAPGLADSRRLRGFSVPQLRNLVRNGIPASGMPAFNLPANELDALATLVHSLNSSAAEGAVPGDPKAGELFFFGRGRCASCHMIYGRGEPIGPDLSSVGGERTAEEIREALLEPSARITPGYELVTVQLRDGRTIRGFTRSRSNFDIRLQDLEGRFHLIQEGEISAIQDEDRSLMQPVKASPVEMQDLIAYLSRLTGVKPGVLSVAPGPQETVDFSRILDPKPGDWLTYNGKLDGNRYSDLTQIDTRNVDKLIVKWIFSVPLWQQSLPDTPYFVENMRYFGLEVTPVVADGIMYVTGPHQAFALDALTGREIWEYSRPRTPLLVGDAALGTNRGVAILDDKVFLVTDNAHLIALNRITGRLVWEVVMPDDPQHYGSTVAPLVVKDMVIAGVSGGDWGIRGFLAAYKALSGERVWRLWTIPSKGEPGSDTWKGREDPNIGGGPTWLTGSYDRETDTLYWPTGNPFPDSDDRDRPGDNLFTNCILALNPDTGKLKWYYQFTPHDTHDWDATEPPVLIDTRYRGQDRKLLLHADRNGFFYVLDRTNGQVLLGTKFIQRLTWASGIGPDGRPQLLPEGEMTCPEDATNWNATAFSPVTRLYYVMALEKCSVKLSPSNGKTGTPPEEPGKKYLRALDIETGKVAWEIPQVGPTEGKRMAGVLATAGGVIFYGDPSGDFVAVDEREGKTLWHFPTNGIQKASPMTYTVGEKQFIALAVGPNILCFGLP